MTERIAMVGAGYFAQFQLEGWRDAGAQVVGLCDLDAARAAAAGRTLRRAAAATATWPTMLDAVQPDAGRRGAAARGAAGAVRAALERGIAHHLPEALRRPTWPRPTP